MGKQSLSKQKLWSKTILKVVIQRSNKKINVTQPFLCVCKKITLQFFLFFTFYYVEIVKQYVFFVSEMIIKDSNHIPK